ncbi:ATP-dependent RecD-like DNA helicase [Clostridium sp. CS001]|uniref:AAA family ATPase n=1 Tax=Clostridium sp. CS001 TaxID=2880648 RepID=UPI001CF347AE|nr:AAA family ATPase [Clostridium sp. CS001]MCB2290849.1 ATP-dependent RecD-like DNA helicase [Clostridium sp. CS001]
MQKIRFTVVAIKHEDITNDICRASVRIKDGNKERIANITYKYSKLDQNKEYEAVVSEELRDKSFGVREIAGVHNVATFAKESLIVDKKVSEEVCKNIIEIVGERSLDILINDIEPLIDLDIMTKDESKYISAKAKKHAELIRVREYCKSHCIEPTTADKIYDRLGGDAIEKIQDNPYMLLRYEVNLSTVDKLANNLGFDYNDEKRVKCGALEYLKYSSDTYGHVFIIQEELIENLNEYMNKYGGYLGKFTINKDLIIGAIGELERDEEIIIYVNVENKKCVYLKELYECEFGIAEIISGMMLEKVEVSKDITNKIDNFVRSYSDGNFKLTKEQGEAVKNAITERISILHGFPGTGKTQSLTAIIQCIRSMYIESKIEVVAFTGKACSRIKEIMPEDIEPKTIHRLLGLGTNKKIFATAIDVDFLIIDEATLIDAKLFHNLLKCCIKENTKVVIIGDLDQISMGVGKILYDLIGCNKIKKVKLTKIFRQGEGSVILNNIQKMTKGIGFQVNKGLKIKKGEFEFIEIKGESDFQNKVEGIISSLINEGESLMNIQILSPIKDGKVGTKKISKMIQEKFNYNSRRMIYDLVVGDKVMQNVNDSKRQVFNGESGLIVRNVDDGINNRVVVRFSNNKVVEYAGDVIKDIESSYSITVHKSQGSQFPIVILPVFKEHRMNLNLLYTACSRAERQVILIGNKEAFESAIKTPQLIKDSNLTELIEVRIKDRLGRTA